VIRGDVIGGVGSLSGRVSSDGAMTGGVTVGGALVGGVGFFSGRISVATTWGR
jgi:hypothetical protein